jgi:hypothetical protein
MQRVELAVVQVHWRHAFGVRRARIGDLHIALVVAQQQRVPVDAAVERAELRVRPHS